MAQGRNVQLTNRQIQQLGAVISRNDMKAIAMGFLDIDNTTIKNKGGDTDAETFNRDIIALWAYKNPNNQVTVNYFSIFTCLEQNARYAVCSKTTDSSKSIN